MFPDGDTAGPNSNTAFDPSPEHFTYKVVLFWQPTSYYPTVVPSSFAVDDVPYSCAEQYMMAERPGFSKNIEQWSSSCRRLVQAHPNASVEACASLALVLGAGRSKAPCYLAPTPNSRKTQQQKITF